MIRGAHCIVYSVDEDADRKFFADVLGLPHVDGGDGFLIFALPPTELGVHDAEANGKHELYFQCDDVEEFIGQMRGRGLACTDAADQGWGVVTTLTLPGGGDIGVYQPRHPSPPRDA